jgi:HD-like signal output (HDOD) protein
LLCSPKDIRYAIQQYYGIHNVILTSTTDQERKKLEEANAEDIVEVQPMEEPETAPESAQVGAALKLEQVVQLIRRLDALPALPETVHRVREAMDDLTVTPKQVSEVICQDPPIAAKVLSVANSAAYGFPNRVESVDLAVALLGLRETYSIVLSSAIMNLFETHKTFDYTQYWEEAIACAAAAKVMAIEFGFEKNKAIFTAALLHSIGRVALLETVPELYAAIPSDLEEEELEAEEMRVLGLTSAEAGYELAMQWGIPESISFPIRYQRHPEFAENHQGTTAMVGLAVFWTRSLALKGDVKKCLKSSAPLLKMLDVDTKLARKTLDAVAGMERALFKWDSEKAAALS